MDSSVSASWVLASRTLANNIRGLFLTALLLGGIFLAADASAHALAPRLMTLTLDEAGVPVAMTWREPTAGSAGRQPAPRDPEGCRRKEPGELQPTETATMRQVQWALDCDHSRAVRGISVDHPPESDVIVVGRIYRAGQLVTEGVLTAERPSLTLGAQQERSFTAVYFLGQGLWHLWTGLDHMAVVAGLILLLGFTRKLVFAVTAFTIGHSITLSAATLGLVSVNLPFAEALIAVTVVAMALEAGHSANGPMKRHPWVGPGLVGLVHGFGFASALSAVGIEKGNALIPLLSFNAGIEVGQLAVVGIILTAVRIAKGLRLPDNLRVRLRRGTEYALGAAGSFWLLQRLGL
jgi:hydrogenase/urease accessory protein HupE